MPSPSSRVPTVWASQTSRTKETIDVFFGAVPTMRSPAIAESFAVAWSSRSRSCAATAARSNERDVVDRRPEADRAADVGGAGLKLVRQVGVRRPLERDRADHVAAALVRRHLLQELTPSPQHADAGRAKQLVAAEDVEIAAEVLHVDRRVADPLCAINENPRADLPRLGNDPLDVDDRAERVARVRRRYEPRALVQQRRQGVITKLAAIVDRQHPQP